MDNNKITHTAADNKSTQMTAIHSPLFYCVLLGIGMALIVSGFLLFVSLADAEGAPDTRANIACTLCGAVFLYLTMIKTRKATHLFLGMFLMLSGVFSMLVAHRLIPYTMNEWWPVLVVFAGICFFTAGMFRRRKLRLAIVFPSITLVVLGTLFMLFSFHVAPMSFRSAVAIFGPFCLMAMGVFIVAFFLLQRKYNTLRINEEDDEADLLDDESEVWLDGSVHSVVSEALMGRGSSNPDTK